jgi:hypothetical protein
MSISANHAQRFRFRKESFLRAGACLKEQPPVRLATIPVGVTREDIKAAVQAAWLGTDFALAKSLVDRYLDCTQPFSVCCACAFIYDPKEVHEYGYLRLCWQCWVKYT